MGCAVISETYSDSMRIPDGGSSFFTTNVKAVDLALDFIRTYDDKNKFNIFSDSLSVLKAVDHTNSKNPHVQNKIEKMSRSFKKRNSSLLDP